MKTLHADEVDKVAEIAMNQTLNKHLASASINGYIWFQLLDRNERNILWVLKEINIIIKKVT